MYKSRACLQTTPESWSSYLYTVTFQSIRLPGRLLFILSFLIRSQTFILMASYFRCAWLILSSLIKQRKQKNIFIDPRLIIEITSTFTSCNYIYTCVCCMFTYTHILFGSAGHGTLLIIYTRQIC